MKMKLIHLKLYESAQLILCSSFQIFRIHSVIETVDVFYEVIILNLITKGLTPERVLIHFIYCSLFLQRECLKRMEIALVKTFISVSMCCVLEIASSR